MEEIQQLRGRTYYSKLLALPSRTRTEDDGTCSDRVRPDIRLGDLPAFSLPVVFSLTGIETSCLFFLATRFGFHNALTIDSLLDKEDVALEAILDEDDLIQECKAQNTRLIDYFGRVDVLHKLLGYVTGQIESEKKGMFKSVPFDEFTDQY
jgi:hypothetical protein